MSVAYSIKVCFEQNLAQILDNAWNHGISNCFLISFPSCANVQILAMQVYDKRLMLC